MALNQSRGTPFSEMGGKEVRMVVNTDNLLDYAESIHSRRSYLLASLLLSKYEARSSARSKTGEYRKGSFNKESDKL